MNEMISRPLPDITPCSRPHWDGLNAEKFLIQSCRRCGVPRHYPRPVCSACYSMDADWITASGTATVHSWTIVHHAYHPAFKGLTPYVVVTADLPEKIRVLARLLAADGRELKIGMPLLMGYEKISSEQSIPTFFLA
jgi:uncharacterized OB-fold protein